MKSKAQPKKIGRKDEPTYRYVNRAKFVGKRYRNFRERKEWIAELTYRVAEKAGMPEREGYDVKLPFHLTDLDQISPDYNKPLKRIVFCDSCNENIAEKEFIMLEEQLCYHEKCVEDRPWFVPRPKLVTKPPAPAPEPVQEVQPEPEAILPPNVLLFKKPE